MSAFRTTRPDRVTTTGSVSKQLDDSRRCERGKLRQLPQCRPGRPFPLHLGGNHRSWRQCAQLFEALQNAGAMALLASCSGLQNLAAGDRLWRGRETQYHVLAGRERNRLTQCS